MTRRQPTRGRTGETGRGNRGGERDGQQGWEQWRHLLEAAFAKDASTSATVIGIKPGRLTNFGVADQWDREKVEQAPSIS